MSFYIKRRKTVVGVVVLSCRESKDSMSEHLLETVCEIRSRSREVLLILVWDGVQMYGR